MAVVQPVLKPTPLVKSGELTREFVEAYSTALNEPEWMRHRRLEALRVFRDTPAPNRFDELWRRVDLSQFKLDGIIAAVRPGDEGATTTHTAPTNMGELCQRGVIFSSFEDAVRNHQDVLDRYLMTEGVKLTDGYFAALHAVFVRGGTLLYVPAGVQLDEPLRASTVMSASARAGFNHTLIVIEEGAKAVLVEEFKSDTPNPLPTTPKGGGGMDTLYNGAVEIILRKGARLDYVNIQDWGRHMWNFTTERAKVDADATLHWVMGGIGAKFTKSLIEADMVGANGVALLSGVYFADGKQHFHYDTQQNHMAEACKSDLLYKAALRDSARTVWRGNIRVFPNAQKTDAYQANRNLQLSDKSRADSIPGLEIEADDVRCTHGSTVGQIEEEPMFYLETRGVPEPEARRLIVEGFFAPVIERIPLEETRDRLIEEIGKKID